MGTNAEDYPGNRNDRRRGVAGTPTRGGKGKFRWLGKRSCRNTTLPQDNRPIFLIEFRDRYVCTWCEMHDGRLILVPSHQSKRHTQPVRYPTDTTIVGRVTGISMDIVEPEESEARA